VQVDPAKVDTNVVVFDVSATGVAPTDVSAGLKQRGILMNPINERCVRAVTHYDVSREQCAQAVAAASEVLAATAAASKPS
jgi:threonine aldolase